MVVLASTFLDCSLVCSHRPSLFLLGARHPPNSSLLAVSSASAQGVDEEHHVHRRNVCRPSAWISFFAGASRSHSITPLIEDPSAAAPADAAGATEAVNVTAHPDQAKIPTKKVSKGTRRVSFTRQKARELRQKLKGSDTFHDFMYHSAIASRLASRDS